MGETSDELLHRTTIDALADALHVIDRGYVIVLANEPFRRWCSALGLSPDLVGKSVQEAFPFLGEDVEGQYRRVFETGESMMSVEETTLDGTRIISETRKVPVWEDGEVHRVITLIRDITEYRSIQAQLHHARKMDALGQLAGGIAHDFNNVLATIMGSAEMIKRGDSSLTENGQRHLEMILQTAEYSADLVAKLLAFGKRRPLTCKMVSVNNVLDDVIAMVGCSIDRNVTVSFPGRAESDVVSVDASALQNALLNIAINAVEAMPEGGELTFETRNVEMRKGHPEASLHSLMPGPYIEVEVSDTGVGIPKDVHEKIFQPFFTTKEEGNGLGLATAYSAVSEFDGVISVESEPGEGTTFLVRFPVRRQY